MDRLAINENVAREYHCISYGDECLLWWPRVQPLPAGSRLEGAVGHVGFKQGSHDIAPLYLVRKWLSALPATRNGLVPRLQAAASGACRGGFACNRFSWGTKLQGAVLQLDYL